jgi:hypothetical protein
MKVLNKDCECKDKKKVCCPFAKSKDATVSYSVDNVVDYYSINGVMNSLHSAADYDNWRKTKYLNVKLAPGDIFCFHGHNVIQPGTTETTRPDNPAAMIATIKYIDYNGKTAWLNTDDKWLCDGVTAVVYEKNCCNTNSIWYKSYSNSYMPNINQNAGWIWSADQTQTSATTCCVTIPCCISKSKL